MSSQINDGGAAFPKAHDPYPNCQNTYTPSATGMSLRDYFAAAALPGIIIATSAGQHIPTMQAGEKDLLSAITRDAYALADAMVAEAKGGDQC